MQAIWAGRIVSAIPVLFMLADGASHIAKPAPVVQAFAQLGYPLSTAVPLGIVAIICVALYMVPRTAFLGTLLLTGYLGGAVSAHVRVGDPLFPTIFPLLIGALLWGGLYLRDARLRALITG
jgi:hypothetical protein